MVSIRLLGHRDFFSETAMGCCSTLVRHAKNLGASPVGERGMLGDVSLGDTLETCPCRGWGIPVTLPDDQGFHEEIQFVLFGAHLRQRLAQEGRRPLAAGVRGHRQTERPSGAAGQGQALVGAPLTFTATCRGLGSLGIPDT